MALVDEIRHIRDDVTRLEINTILKANMSAQKMPRPRHALIDIANRYGGSLLELARDDAKYAELRKEATCDVQAFDTLRGIAEREGARRALALERRRASLSEEQRLEAQRTIVLLGRIRRNCDHVKGMLHALDRRHPGLLQPGVWTRSAIEGAASDQRELPLTANERVLLRKVWELGADEVVMQTVVQLDGDVVTRIDPRYARAGSEAIRAFHAESTEVSLRMWKDLVETVASFFRSIVKGLRG